MNDQGDPARDNQTSAERLSELAEQRPGALTSQQVPQLTLHTNLGQMLFLGRKHSPEKPEIVGLIRFASQCRIIWHGALNDDPYADWWLIKIEKALQASSHEIQVTLKELKQRFDRPNLSLPIGVSEKPLHVPLQFTSAYAYQGAYLIADLDLLARTVMSARHFGLMTTNDTQRLLMLAGRSVRRTFLVSMTYKFSGINRSALAQDNAALNYLVRIMGEVPKDIMRGITRAQFVPLLARLEPGIVAEPEQSTIHE